MDPLPGASDAVDREAVFAQYQAEFGTKSKARHVIEELDNQDAADRDAVFATYKAEFGTKSHTAEVIAAVEYITTKITGLDREGNRVDRREELSPHTGLESELDPLRQPRDPPDTPDTPGLWLPSASSEPDDVSVYTSESVYTTQRQIQDRLEIGYQMLCDKSGDTEAVLRPGLPSIQFDLPRDAVNAIAHLLCTRSWAGGDLGDPGFFRAENGEESGGKRQMWLRDYPVLLESVMAGMKYDCSTGSTERLLLEANGRFKIRVKGTCDTGAGTQKNFHADETEFRDCVRVVGVLWGPRTWFLDDSNRVNRWLHSEVIARVRSNRRSLTRIQLAAAKRAAKLKKCPQVKLGFTVGCVVAEKQCSPVIEPFGMGWDTLTCKRVLGTTSRPCQLVHAVPTSSEVGQFGFGMPGTRGLVDGVQGEISRIVVVFDGLPMPTAG